MAKRIEKEEKVIPEKSSPFSAIASHCAVAIIFLCIGFWLYPVYSRYQLASAPIDSPDAPTYQGRIKRYGNFKLIKPILECEVGTKKQFKEFAPLSNLIRQAVDTEQKGGTITRASVYYRALNSGRWVGLNEDDTYPAGSLVKIPFMLAYYKLAETDPDILNEQITYKGDFDEVAGQITKPGGKLIEAGKSYSVTELIYRMIVYSGNNSSVLLMRRLDRNYLKGVFGDLGVSGDQDEHRQWIATTKTFSSFFRTLFNATYLSDTQSEKALELLAKTDFKEGLVAGLPPDVQVAHKFGEEVIMESTGRVVSASLHDCGIVYHAKYPYFLCVMTEGTSHPPLKGVIARISKIVYAFVDSEDYPVAPP